MVMQETLEGREKIEDIKLGISRLKEGGGIKAEFHRRCLEKNIASLTNCG